MTSAAGNGNRVYVRVGDVLRLLMPRSETCVRWGIAGTPVYVFERLRFADAEPLALMRNHVPEHLLQLSAADLEAQGLYNLFRANGIGMRIAKQAIGARAATAAEARALGERKGAPLLVMERSAYDEQGRAVEHGHHLYRASRYSFDLALTAW